ncbi:helix-turn-helix transcriptional regulator [Pseudomonas saliphila]|uniref:helix-turn-helix transcriptional regulator n=1 Tax=Pseudomonas saliphila TaxID=2586906 RepID=UPI00123B1A66
MSTSEVLKTTNEICAILRVSRQTLWRLTKDNPSLPGRVRIGRLTRWSEKELIGWLNSR